MGHSSWVVFVSTPPDPAPFLAPHWHSVLTPWGPRGGRRESLQSLHHRPSSVMRVAPRGCWWQAGKAKETGRQEAAGVWSAGLQGAGHSWHFFLSV